jgi:hypothetical protein
MRLILFGLVSGWLMSCCSLSVQGQVIKLDFANLTPNQVAMSIEHLMGKQALRVTKDSTVKAVDEPTFVTIKALQFTDGTIEVKVLSRLLKSTGTSPWLYRRCVPNQRNQFPVRKYLYPPHQRPVRRSGQAQPLHSILFLP